MNLMKKLSLYIFLVLMVCNVGFAKNIYLKCVDSPDAVDFGYKSIEELRVVFNKKIIEIFDGENTLEFKVDSYEQDKVTSQWRGLEKGNTSYDTHVKNWDIWDHIKYKDYLYRIAINRLDGELYKVRSKEPWSGQVKYSNELIGLGICESIEQKF